MDATDTNFERRPVANKLPTGAWPFNCEEIIYCKDTPGQTCGCKDSYTNGEDRGIVYFIGTDSKQNERVNFKSCEELQFHGVTIGGYFMINGEKTYCGNWSKKLHTASST